MRLGLLVVLVSAPSSALAADLSVTGGGSPAAGVVLALALGLALRMARHA